MQSSLQRQKPSILAPLQSTFITIGLLGLATGVSIGFSYFKIEEANIIMVYMLSVIGVANLTKGYLPSTVASIAAVLLFNFGFTEPRFSFNVINSSYVFTFAFMLLSALMMSSITNKMQKAMLLAKSRERRTQLLFHISQRLIRIEKLEDVAEVIGEECSSILHRRILVATSSDNKQLQQFLYFQKGIQLEHFPALASHHFASMSNVFTRHLPEIVTPKFKGDANVYYVPVTGKRSTFGIIGFILKEGETINEEHCDLGMAIAAMMSNAFEHFNSNR